MRKPLLLTISALPMIIGTAVICLTGCQTQSSTPSNGAAASSADASTVAAPAHAIYRVKAGTDKPFTDSNGDVWQADQGFDGGDVVERDPSTKVENTKDPAMFMTEHYSMNSFSCKIPNGKYIAKLYFAETFDGIGGPGQRVFSFNVQGHEFKDFDVWVKAGGPYRVYVETVPVKVTDGIFKITFTSQVENPEINAIEIIPQS